MDFEQFVITGSRAIRHDLINALFVAQVTLDLEDEIEENRFEIINSQIEKAFSIIDVWKELEVFGEESSWQELKTLLLRAVAQSGRIVSIDVYNAKLKTNGLFHFVFTNLIDNSMRHGGKEGIKIRIYSKIEEGDLIIVCEDDGVGVLEADKQRIFAQGFGKHTGLGMFFSRQIIELMGGTIVENGVPGEGARFEIRLPEDIYKISNGDL